MTVKEYFNQIENDMSNVFIEIGKILKLEGVSQNDKIVKDIHISNIKADMRMIEKKYFLGAEEDFFVIKDLHKYLLPNEYLDKYDDDESHILNLYKGLRKILIDMGYIERKKSISELNSEKTLIEQLEEIKNKCKK